jgi:phage terminase large subunit
MTNDDTQGMKATSVFYWNYTSEADVIINQGGTSSGKTYAIMQVLLLKAISEPNVVITVGGQDMPNLLAGSVRDTEEIVKNNKFIEQEIKKHRTRPPFYEFKNGSIIEFKSYDDEQDAKNGKRDYLFVNEANGIDYRVYEQLAVRTKKQVFIDYNPSARFWVHRKLLPEINNPDAIIKIVRFISNYTHNEHCPKKTILKIESRRADKNWFRVYGKGMTGKVDGLIFKEWQRAYKMPTNGNNYALGLDFGYTGGKTALVISCEYDRKLWTKQLVYESYLSNEDLAKQIKAMGFDKHEIYADSADPRSIDDLKKAGIRKVYGINKANNAKEWSIKEINKYEAWMIIGNDIEEEVTGYAMKNGRIPKKDDHLIDAARYYILGLNGRVGSGFKVY